MTRLRTGAMPSIADGRDAPAPDPAEVGARAREDASLYAAWLDAGKPREVIEAERRRLADARRRRSADT